MPSSSAGWGMFKALMVCLMRESVIVTRCSLGVSYSYNHFPPHVRSLALLVKLRLPRRNIMHDFTE